MAREDLGIANARMEGGFLFTNQLFAPPIGAFLFAAGMAIPFMVNVVAFALGAILVSRVVTSARTELASGYRPGLRTEMAEGIRWLVAHPPMRTLTLTILAFNVTFGAAWSVMVLYSSDRLGMDELGFGLLTTSTAIGGIVGMALYGRLERRFSLGALMRFGLVIEMATHLSLAITQVPAVAMATLVVFGFHEFMWGTIETVVRQRAVPDSLLGRNLRRVPGRAGRRPRDRRADRRFPGAHLRPDGAVLVRFRRVRDPDRRPVEPSDAHRGCRRGPCPGCECLQRGPLDVDRARREPIVSQDRIESLRDSLPFYQWYGRSPHRTRGGQPGVMDLLFGNPHDMPIPAYVDALLRHTEPLHPSWYAYMLDHPAATETAAADLRAHTGMAWDAGNIAMTTGGWGAIAIAIRMVTEPGDEVIYYDPPWFFYDILVRGAEAVPVVLKLEAPRFSPDPAQLAAAITPRTKAVLINTPHNPSGRVLDATELQGIAEVLRDASARFGHPIYLLSDEAYRLIVLDGRRSPSPAEFYEHTLVLYSYGKQLLAPGQRIGYLGISPRISDQGPLREAATLARFVNSYGFPNNTLQRALPEVSRLCIDVAAIQRRRDHMVPVLEAHGFEPTTPEGTFYIMARSPDPDDEAFVARMAVDDLFILPGTTVMMPGWFRISLTASDAMIDAAAERFSFVRTGV